MEYGQRQELKSEPVKERTTMMMRSVREILEAQGQGHLLDETNFEAASEAPTMPPRPMPGAAKAASAAEKGGVQRPPHMQGVVCPTLATGTAAPAPSPFSAAGREAHGADRSRSILSRLIGR